MYHVPLTAVSAPEHRIEFSHFGYEAAAGHWKKENSIRAKTAKINVFCEGDFSLFVGSEVYRPTCGDICIFSPEELHRAHVYRNTTLQYYQIDVGEHSLDTIAGGRELFASLTRVLPEQRRLFKPREKDTSSVFTFLGRIESAISTDNKPLAFAYTVEFLSFLNTIHAGSDKVPTLTLSRTTGAVIDCIEKRYGEPLTLDKIADLVGCSPSYLSRAFKKEIGVGVHEYLTDYRTVRATRLLREHSVTDTCYLCGFSDASHFISVFKKRFGVTPMNYKKDMG